MKKTPYIKWYQNTENVYIEILNYSNNDNIIFKDILYYEDDIYKLELDFFQDCILDNTIYTPNILTLILKKQTNIEWKQLLKDKNKYSYFISINWDKLIMNDIFLKNNVDYDSDEFQQLLKSGELDKISDTDTEEEVQEEIEEEIEEDKEEEIEEEEIKEEEIEEEDLIKNNIKII